MTTLSNEESTAETLFFFVFRYGVWRVMSGLHRSIEFNMMEAGHTKFSPDWHFGLWKVCTYVLFIEMPIIFSEITILCLTYKHIIIVK